MRLLALALLLPSLTCAQDLSPGLKNSVVKIFTTFQRPNYYQPWQMVQQESLTGSGAVIGGGRILTNAHVVSNQTYLQVRKAGDPARYTARVEFVGHDAELAVLRVDDPKFYAGLEPLRFGTMPRQRDRLAAYGFPAGGDELSITEGTVSRIEVTRYSHAGNELLAIQTDAAINPGNSGGPVFAGDRVVGVSFQSYSGSGVENTGYVVPVTMIRRFLKDIEDGRYDGVPALGILTQKLENAALRRFAKLPEGRSGILVKKVLEGPAAGVLERGDVLTAIDGQALANDRTFAVPEGGRLDYTHLIALHQSGEPVQVDLLRDGKPLRREVVVRKGQELVDGPFFDKQPSYFVYSGLVFTPLTRNYLSLWEQKDQSVDHRFFQDYGLRRAERPELVLLAYTFAHDLTDGYSDWRGLLVDKINGRSIGGIRDVVEAFKSPQDGFHVIDLLDQTEWGTRIVLDAAKAAQAHDDILKTYRLPSDRSEDLLETAAAAGAPTSKKP